MSMETWDELVEEYGILRVEEAEEEALEPGGAFGLDNPSLGERLYLRGASREVAEGYVAARLAGECPVWSLPERHAGHWDVWALCDMMPCPECVADSTGEAIFGPLEEPGPVRPAEYYLDDDSVYSEEIPI